MSPTPRQYPRSIQCGDLQLEIARMSSADRAALTEFIARLPAHDLLFLSRDITHPKVIDAWMRALDRGEINSLIVRHGTEVLGCTAIIVDPLGWSAHVGELRIMVSAACRGLGLGRILVQECFAQAVELGLKKLVAQMTTSQRAGVTVFEELGFRAEALLAKHVADREGGLHDLVLLSHDVETAAARRELYGLDALGD